VQQRFFGLPSTYIVYVLLTSVSRFLGQSAANESQSVATFYVCVYIDRRKPINQARLSKFKIKLKWNPYRIWIFERSIELCAAKC
jgi:hypothetical protein